jgi:CheY-like chemotaxis protein
MEKALKVLVVDDDPTTVKLMLLWLARQGFHARGAESAEAAHAEAESHAPDVLLTDLSLPGMSGSQLLAALRARFERLKAIALTGSSREDTPDADAFDDFLTKPVDLHRLTKTLHATTNALAQNQ